MYAVPMGTVVGLHTVDYDQKNYKGLNKIENEGPSWYDYLGSDRAHGIFGTFLAFEVGKKPKHVKGRDIFRKLIESFGYVLAQCEPRDRRNFKHTIEVLAPQSTKVGDLLVFPADMPFPVMLRKASAVTPTIKTPSKWPVHAWVGCCVPARVSLDATEKWVIRLYTISVVLKELGWTEGEKWRPWKPSAERARALLELFVLV